MSYIHSSPWQDAANFGGAIGDRLSEALINLPLKKQQFAIQMLQAAQQQKQQGFENQLQTNRLGVEQERVGAEKQHYQNMDNAGRGKVELKREEDFQKGLGDIVSGYRKDTVEADKMDVAGEKNKTANRALDIKNDAAHHVQVSQYLNTMAKSNTELAGLMVKATHGLPFEPEEQAKFDAYTKKASDAMSQMQDLNAPGLGDAAKTNTPSTNKKFKYDPSSGNLLPIQ